MTKSEFVSTAKPLQVLINGVPVASKPLQFKSEKRSVGYNFTGKVPVVLPDGTTATLQISGNATVCGSGEWQDEVKAAA